MDSKRNHRRGYENNKAWQVGMQVAAEIYRLTPKLPKSERYGLAQQLRRCAVSVPSNIAEGNSVGSDGLYLRHVRIARGSVGELATQLQLVDNLELLPDGVPPQLRERVQRLARLVTGLWRYLRRKTGKA